MPVHSHDFGYWRRLLLLSAGALCLIAVGPLRGSAAPPGPYSKEYRITVDPTALLPPTHWYVPGITPHVANLDPDTTDAFSTAQRRHVLLKPGQYRFGTFTFDFPFAVTLEGMLDFSSSLDQCVEGRGSRTLTVRCSQTQPYVGPPEY